MIKIATIEDLLEFTAGLQEGPKISLDRSDISILHSIARQVFKGTPLTDRQFSLAQSKLKLYIDQFLNLDIDFDYAIDNLRYPLREIDRSKYIKIVNTIDVLGKEKIYESYKSDWQWIKIRFPFSKKLIVALDAISKRDYHHEKGTHEHFYKFTEKTVFDVIEIFKEKNFDIDPELYNYYNKVKEINDNPFNYLPGISNFKIKNCHPNAEKVCVSELGQPSINNLFKYKDRRYHYGLHYFDSAKVNESLKDKSSLTNKIVCREKRDIFLNRKIYSAEDIVTSIIELDRFPLLVLLNENDALYKLKQYSTAFNVSIDNSQQTVLFRLDNDSNKDFNEYIKDNNLNNPVDKNTKVVYINTEKLPKPLLKTNIFFNTVLLTNSVRPSQKVGTYVECIDMSIHHDESISQMMRFNRQGIQEL